MGKSTSDFIREVGARIKRRREDRRLDQKPFAKNSGISPTTLSSIELGKQATNLAILKRISEQLQCEPWQLLKLDETEMAQVPPPSAADAPALIGEIVVLLGRLNQDQLAIILRDAKVAFNLNQRALQGANDLKGSS